MPISLEDRFQSFMKSVSFAESIDALLLDEQYKERQKDKQRADYLLFDRKLILELKTGSMSLLQIRSRSQKIKHCNSTAPL
jgi:hypothetical protein